MELSAPVDEDELNAFRSSWQQELERVRSLSPVRSRSIIVESQEPQNTQALKESSPRSSLDDSVSRVDVNRPVTPLEIYENGIMKERQGNLSEAVFHYRKALRMDPDVDKQYKQKYFSPGAAPIPMRNVDDFQSGYSIQEYHPSSTTTDTISTLTEAFASLSILRIEAEDSEKPCFLGTLPDELLVNILYHLSLDSLDSLARTALVCKKLFTLSQGENSLYKALCMHYFRPFDSPSTLLSRISEYNNDWRRMLIERPRIRFDGCYIATCHYLRPGVNEYSWNTPIHMVTYFRYMRFYENGRCLTVLSSIEPREVVRSVSWSGSVGLKGVSDGVWSMKEGGAVLVQVRGPKGYTFIKELQIKNTARGKHNKLVWTGFHSENQHDGEKIALSMKNEKSFYFSKVRSYADELQ